MSRILYCSAFVILFSLYVMSVEGIRCKERGETCRGLPRCCGDLVCTSEGKYNPVKGGKCGDCGQVGKDCVLDNQCCEGLQCDKEDRLSINGNCRSPRPAGTRCHTDSQCREECVGKWYHIYGECRG